MLIICSGPDTFRAREKARELERAFREKYDPDGTAVERIAGGKTLVDDLIEKSLTTSLFTPRRFIRVDGLFEALGKARVSALASALAKEPDNVIVVDVEEEPPTASVLKPFEKEVKLIPYDFPALTGAAFFSWCRDQASKLGGVEEGRVKQIAETYEGDGWTAWNELAKSAAGGTFSTHAAELDAYAMADAWLAGQSDRMRPLADDAAASEASRILLQSVRAAARARDGAVEGLHPYVVRKLGRMRLSGVERLLGAAITAHVSARAGLSDEAEASTLLP